MMNHSKLILFKSLGLCNTYHGSVNIFQNINRFKYSFPNLEKRKSNDQKVIRLTIDDLTPIQSQDSDDLDIKKVGDIVHKFRLSQHGRRHDVDFYLHLIMRAASEGDTKKMLTVFFHDMLIVDRVKPNVLLIHKLLQKLSELGGHSEAAFKIVKKMRDIRIMPTSVTYSLLFSNCAKEIANNELYWNLTNKTIKLVSKEEMEKIQAPAQKAFQLWKQLNEDKDLILRSNSINALLLTLCRAGMLKESFIILDAFLENGNRPNDYTLSAMLEGCLHDRRSGFGLALAIFNRLVYQHKCRISPHVISTLLKVVKNCQFGNSLVIESISPVAPPSSRSFFSLHNICNVESSAIVTQNETAVHCIAKDYNKVIVTASEKYGLKNVNDFIESHYSTSSTIVHTLKSPTNMLKDKTRNKFNPQWLQSDLAPSDKLACIGGILGFISLMEKNHISPNLFILTSLVSCLPYDKIRMSAQEPDEFFTSVIKALSSHYKMPPETTFQNALYKRNITCLQASDPENIDPQKFDPYTWSIYGKKCKTAEDVRKFFKLMRDNGIIPNKEIYFTVLRSVWTWGPRLCVLQKMYNNKIDLDRAIIVHIEDEIAKARERIKTLTDSEREFWNFKAFYTFQELYSQMLDKRKIDPVSTGDQKIQIDELPDLYNVR